MEKSHDVSKTVKISGKRISLIRKRAGLTQKEFGEVIARAMGRDHVFAITTVSAWELGRKQPSYSVIETISKVCNCNYLYLIGLTDKIVGTITEEDLKDNPYESKEMSFGAEIEFYNLIDYNGKPVWLMFPDTPYSPIWALVDTHRSRFITVDNILKFDDWKDTVKVYECAFYYSDENNIQNMKRLSPYTVGNYESVYVQHIGLFARQNSCYNGWYHVNAENNLLHSDTGYTLMFEKMGIYYNAYGNYQ